MSIALTGLATGAVALGEVTALDHELLDDTVEGRVLVAVTLLASSKGTEVLDGLGDGLAVETDDDTAQILVAMLDVEKDLVGDLGALACLSGLRKQESAEAKEQQGADENPAHVKHGGQYLLIN